MTAKEPRCINSDDSVAWQAYREAEKLDDPSLVEELTVFLQDKRENECRRAAYFILGKLGRKVHAFECSSILLSYVNKETNKYMLSHLLDALGGIRKPKTLDLSPIFQLLKDERWLVRHAAIGALKLTDSLEAEERILELLQTTDDPHNVTYCHATLSEIGTAKALPFIEKNLKSRKRDVKASAQWAINAINARMGGEIAVRESTFDTPYRPM
jgi:HEAT repeat protein